MQHNSTTFNSSTVQPFLFQTIFLSTVGTRSHVHLHLWAFLFTLPRHFNYFCAVRVINASATSAYCPIGGNNQRILGSPLPLLLLARSATCWCRRPEPSGSVEIRIHATPSWYQQQPQVLVSLPLDVCSS